MKVQNGQPLKFKKDNFETFVCCNCSLVHEVVLDKDVTMITYRDDYLTNKARNGKRKGTIRKDE